MENRKKKSVIENNPKFKVSIILLITFVFFSLSIISSYVQSVPAYTYGGQTSTLLGGTTAPVFDQSMCNTGQDFILQVDPKGCAPVPVTSNLLSQQPVNVFCPIDATQLNPLIKVSAIQNIVITSPNLPQNVLTVGYQPAQAALAQYNPYISSPYLGNIGYATIVLKQQPNESAMPDFVNGSLTANLHYNLNQAFGVGQAVYYLPQTSDAEWNKDIAAYGFSNGKGYIRLDGTDSKTATISVYSDLSQQGVSSSTVEKTKVATFTLKPGDTSSEVFLPGFSYCLGGFNVKLQDLENPAPTAKLMVDSDVVDAKASEPFLNGQCTVNSVTTQGINQNVKISCTEDQTHSTFTLGVNPRITLTINGVTKEYGVGDYLYSYDPGKAKGLNSVYLAFVGNSGRVNAASDLYIRLLALPQSKGGTETSLTSDQIAYVAGYDAAKVGLDIRTGVAGKIAEGADFALATLSQAFKAGLSGNQLAFARYADLNPTLFGTPVKIVGYAGVYDTDLSRLPIDTQNYYTKAMSDYQTIIQNYAGETYPDSNTVKEGQEALTNAINLANSFGQKRAALQLCQQYSQSFASGAPEICSDQYLLSSLQTSQQSVLISGVTHVISFSGIQQPSFDQFGIEISVQYPPNDPNCTPDNGCVNNIRTEDLSDNGIFYVNDKTSEYIQLSSLSINSATGVADSATFNTNLIATGTNAVTTIVNSALQPSTQTLKIGVQNNFGSKYSFTVQKINLQEAAKVTISPTINYVPSNATFNFSIGIEKSAVKLSPAKTKELIQSTNSTINDLTKLSNTIGKVVTVGKTACLVTETGLLVKNFIANLGGAGAARQTVMQGPGGWDAQCNALVKAKTYTSLEQCLQANSNQIDASVNAYNAGIQAQNQKIQDLSQTNTNTNTLTTALLTQVQSTLPSQLSSCGMNQITVANKPVDTASIIPGITATSTTLSQVENLQLNAGLICSSDPTVKAIAQTQVQQTLGQIYSNSQVDVQRKTLSDQYGIGFTVSSSQKLTDLSLTSISTFANVKDKVTLPPGIDIPLTTYVTGYGDQANGNVYLLTLDNNYIITQTYLITNGVLSVADPKNINPLKLSPKRVDSTTYSNPYSNPQVQYFETGQYAGLPAIVPFDTKNGWYAAIQSNLPSIGGLSIATPTSSSSTSGSSPTVASYAASGVASNYFVCNVGPNGKEEGIAVGDDNCFQFIPGTNQPPAIGGISTSEAQTLMNKASAALTAAAQQHTAGVARITLPGGQSIPVGQPSANTPALQCEDFMSPSDCNIMFNVCDPVVCPSSRCNLGGAYPVKDVIQTGIIGGLLLCKDNYPQVKVPICISGINAGLQGYLSVLKSYQQCLNTSLTTGQTTGICSQLYDIYACQFFWQQGIPIINYAVPKLIASATGQSNNGGGEYIAGSNALTNAQKSIDYFSQFYAANSYKAFQERSTQDVGNAICQNFISLVTPSGGNLLNTLVAPDSPSQFYGQFSEAPYTTATNPPTSQYNVYYHVYAGTDYPAYYQVYLKGSTSSFYQDTNVNRVVGTGYIALGGSVDNTTVFTAPSGYQQLCIVINGQEQCGFQKVTTDFGINTLTQQAAAQQAAQTDITTESNCVSGTPSLYSLINVNPQAGVSNVASPAIYNQGVIRICATSSPGQATDLNWNSANARWRKVGYCDNQNLGCWLDTQSVSNVIQDQNILNPALQATGTQYAQALMSQGTTLDSTGFSSLVTYLTGLQGQDTQIINTINENLSKVSLNNQKAELYLRRGDSYTHLAIQGYNQIVVPCTSCLQSNKQWCVNSGVGSCVDIGTCTTSPTAAGFPGETTEQAQSACSTITNGVTDTTTQQTVQQTEAQQTTQCVSCVIDSKMAWCVDSSGLGKCVNSGTCTENVVVDGGTNEGISAQDASTFCSAVGTTPKSLCLINLADTSSIPAPNVNIYSQTDLNAWCSSPSNAPYCIGGVGTWALRYGTCVSTTSTTCTNVQGCQKILGATITKLAQQAQQERAGDADYSTITAETGAKNFPCLVLQQALIESGIQQCKDPLRTSTTDNYPNNNPLYCEGDKTTTLGGDTGNSVGTMQINLIAHPDAASAVYTFDENVDYGINALLDGYNDDPKGYPFHCYKQADGTFVTHIYTGWERALRNYNGWNINSPCTDSKTGQSIGNPNYVSDVEGKSSTVAALFPDLCGPSAP